MLPDAVRSRVIGLAADVLGAMRPDEVPASLRTVAKFTSTKRAKLGTTPIAAALEKEPAFRARVAKAAAAGNAELADAVWSGEPPPAADPVDVATMAYLARPDGWEDLVRAADAAAASADSAALAARESAAADRLREQLAAARATARESREKYRAEIERLKAENSRLRRRLAETRKRAAAARDGESTPSAELARAVAEAERAREAAEAEARRLRRRLAEVEDALTAARRSSREGRDLETARLGLLIDTLAEAAAGLRRELALPATTVRPADTVASATPAVSTTGEARARDADDPAVLSDLLALPRAHLIVDGYNVTKSAWPQLSLEAQRTRLVQSLGVLAARTGAEVTCVFDGADVSVPPPVGPASGVRVRFSPPGASADELIRRLVRAEPPGRPLVVVSSDREVADGVAEAGARPVPAAALARLVSR